MEEKAGSIDVCVHWLEKDVLDLLRLRGVITKLSTNWKQLKQSLREKGLLRDTQSVDDFQGPTPPTVPAEYTEAISRDHQSVDDLQGSTPSTVSVESINEALHTADGFIRPVRQTDTSGYDEPAESIESSTEPSARELFIGPVIPTDAVKSIDKDVELISVEPGPNAVGFIGPVIPGDAAKSSSEHGEISSIQTAVEDGGTVLVVEQNENGSMETSESVTVQSSGLQMR